MILLFFVGVIQNLGNFIGELFGIMIDKLQINTIEPILYINRMIFCIDFVVFEPTNLHFLIHPQRIIGYFLQN